MAIKRKAEVVQELSELKEDKKTLLKRIEDLEKDNEILFNKLKEQDLIVDFLRKENKYLLPLYTCKLPKAKGIYFMSYICSYYKVSIEKIKGNSRQGILPYVRQISSYFLMNHFDWTRDEVKDYIECDRTTIYHSIDKIKGLIDIDRSVLKDVLAHRDWLEKLNKV